MEPTSLNENTNSVNNTSNGPYPPAYPPPYPIQSTPEQIGMPQPQVPPIAQPSVNPESYQYPYVSPQQQLSQGSINDAVDSAFHGSDTSYISPDIVAQITANVIQQLKLSGADHQRTTSSPQQQWAPATTAPMPAYTEPSLRQAPQPPQPSPQAPSPNVVDNGISYQQPPRPDIYPSNTRLSPRPSPGTPRSTSSPVKEERPPPPVRQATELSTLEKIW